MTRKDSEKDSERPHYYSQFWLDVAAGRRVIGTPRSSDEPEVVELELEEPATQRRAGTTRFGDRDDMSALAPVDGHIEAEGIAHPVAEPIVAPEEFIEPESEPEEQDLGTDELDLEKDTVEDSDIPDMDLGLEDEEEEAEEELYEEEDEEEVDEEEEEEEGWGGRGRKRNKPVRQPPKITKRPKREPRRGF